MAATATLLASAGAMAAAILMAPLRRILQYDVTIPDSKGSAMIPERPSRMALIVAAAAGALLLRAAPVLAIGSDEPTSTPAATDQKTSTPKTDATDKTKSDKTKGDKEKVKDKTDAAKTDKKSELQFRKGYRHAYDLIYRRHDYVAAIAALRALHHDNQADVATLLGYSSRKLGRYDDAKYWYDKALAADPRHATTLSYYGMWFAEQGNRLKALDYLRKVRLICGTNCRAYRELKDVIAGTASY
jgi:tetratricopeptide (TPR) repeat protein